MGLITALAWDRFIRLQTQSHGDFMTKDVLWYKAKGYRNRYNEDADPNPQTGGYDIYTLKALCNYNYERTWPIVKRSESGVIDKQSVQLMLSVPLLKQAGLFEDNTLIYNPGKDYFTIEGKRWEYEGDTAAGQTNQSNTNGDPLIFTIILVAAMTATKPY